MSHANRSTEGKSCRGRRHIQGRTRDAEKGSRMNYENYALLGIPLGWACCALGWGEGVTNMVQKGGRSWVLYSV